MSVTRKHDLVCGHPKPPDCFVVTQNHQIGLWFSLNHHLEEDLQLFLDNGLWFSLNLNVVEELQILLENILWSSLNQHSRALPINIRHQLPTSS
jgi:hypothetical protein